LAPLLVLAFPRDDRWSEALAVGTLPFVERVKNDLGIRAMHREVLETDGTYAKQSGLPGRFGDDRLP
jgi:hypothetical protein